jgi:hypothetical protein
MVHRAFVCCIAVHGIAGCVTARAGVSSGHSITPGRSGLGQGALGKSGQVIPPPPPPLPPTLLMSASTRCPIVIREGMA